MRKHGQAGRQAGKQVDSRQIYLGRSVGSAVKLATNNFFLRGLPFWLIPLVALRLRLALLAVLGGGGLNRGTIVSVSFAFLEKSKSKRNIWNMLMNGAVMWHHNLQQTYLSSRMKTGSVIETACFNIQQSCFHVLFFFSNILCIFHYRRRRAKHDVD